MDLSYLYLILFPDGNIQDGDTLSPTDIEANLSTEVALTVLDVLELFVYHHKVCGFAFHITHSLCVIYVLYIQYRCYTSDM